MLNPFTLSLGDSNPSAGDWKAGAYSAMSDAKLLLLHGIYQSAYIQAGLAVECALKAYVMRAERLNSWPNRKSRPDLYSHLPGRLMNAAGLRPALYIEVRAVSDIGLAWMVVKDFDIAHRYPRNKPFPATIARDFVDAIDGLGLVEWLTAGI